MPAVDHNSQCPTCGYDLSAATDPICPECGNAPTPDEDASLLALQTSLFLVYGAWTLACVECGGVIAGSPQWYFAYDGRTGLYAALLLASSLIALSLRSWAARNLLRPRTTVYRLLGASAAFATALVVTFAIL